MGLERGFLNAHPNTSLARARIVFTGSSNGLGGNDIEVTRDLKDARGEGGLEVKDDRGLKLALKIGGGKNL